jgi:hypothetical protein
MLGKTSTSKQIIIRVEVAKIIKKCLLAQIRITMLINKPATITKALA